LGAEYSYAIPFEAYAAAGGQVLSPGPSPVLFDTVRLQGCGRCSFQDGELEVHVDGVILVESAVSVEQTANNGRTISEVYLERQPSGGAFAVVGGSLRFIYTRNSGDGNLGTGEPSATIEVAAGDKVRVVAAVRSGTGVIEGVANASQLRVTFLATNE
jgi:hypothetical protein